MTSFFKFRRVFPNLKEAHEMSGIHATTPALAEKVARLFMERFKSRIVFKRSEHGMTLFENNRAKIVHLPAQAREVFDVTGAGDTVLAVVALAIGAGMGFRLAAEIANHAAGIVIEKEGTAAPTRKELVNRLAENYERDKRVY